MTAETFIRSLPEEDKVAPLRLQDGGLHLGAELYRLRRAALRSRHETSGKRRTAGELREAGGRLAADRHRDTADLG